MALALSVVACSVLESSPPPDAGLVVREDLALRWSQGLPVLPEVPPAPAEYGVAVGQWRTATTAFSIGAYDDAARDFLAVADTLMRPGAGPLDDTLRAGRCIAYENAASALEGARDPSTGVASLGAARTRDPGCRASITRILDRLSVRTSTAALASPPAKAAAE